MNNVVGAKEETHMENTKEGGRGQISAHNQRGK